LAEPVEVAIYYAVSEALANALKHAHATEARVEVRTEDRAVRASICDADPAGLASSA
jgi:signal transduction histidine kinase